MKLMRLVLFLFPTIVFCQTNIGLIAYYPLDSTLADATGTTANNGIPSGTPGIQACGPINNALFLNSGADQITFLGNVNDEFDTEDFTLSLYFKSRETGTQYILSKRSEDCEDPDHVFFIRYAPLGENRGTLNIVLREDADNGVSMLYTIQNEACWQHLVLVREKNKVKLYLNGAFVQEAGTDSRIDILNDGNLILGGSNCKNLVGQNERNFGGFIDDFRVYNRALDDDEISRLYFKPDRIATSDTIIFLGNSVPIQLSKTCVDNFFWSPQSSDISDNTDPEPIITPVSGGAFTYNLFFQDNLSRCVAKDSITIRVIDPALLGCDKVFLPNAFTPNDDNLNDMYGISNPFAVQQLLSFEIFDRWGNRVFFTDNPLQKWDGTYLGKEVNPGILSYKILFMCNTEEKIQIGNFAIIR